MSTDVTTEMNFSIQETNMGAGNQQIVDNLLSPETQTATPESVTPIVKEVTPPEVTPPIEKPEEGILNFFTGTPEEEEEEEEEEVKTTTNTETTLTPEATPEETQFAALAKDLGSLGVFTTEEGETETPITTAQEFLERFNAEKKKGASLMVQNFIGQFGEDYQKAFEAIYVKGVDPKDYFTVYNNTVGFSELDLTLEDNQVKVIRQALTDQGFEPEDVTTELERLKNYGDLESVATKHHKVLVKKEALKLQQLEVEAEAALQQKESIRGQYITNVQSILSEKLKTKEFDGIPLNPKLVNELQDFLLVDKWKTTSGETLTDFDRAILDLKRPENHAMKVKLGLLLKILEKDPTLSTIQKTGVSKNSNQLFGEIAKQQADKSKTSPATSGGKPSPNDPWTFKM